MKTLAVLSAVLGLAITAPAPQDGFDGIEVSSSFNPLEIHSEINGPIISARSHVGVSNPVIVQKRTGYRVYRDSTEERADADPHEKCGKQVRVKLCDHNLAAKSADLRRSTKTEDHTQKDDVHDSIKLAKEAVESIQHDLKLDTSGKNTHWKHREADKDLHQDIEATRIALEHAQRQFGNMESMNMRAATIKDSEILHDVKKAKIEEEKLAQWKEAIENIQRNVEIARNIEDSFKAAEDHSSFANSESIDTTKLMRSDGHEKKAEFHDALQTTSLATSGRKAFDQNNEKRIMETKTEQRTISHNTEDMKSAASESVHINHQHHHHDQMHHKSEATQGKLAEANLELKGQPLALKTDANVQLTKEKGLHVGASLRNSHDAKTMSAQESIASKMMQSESSQKTTFNKEMSSRTSENMHQHFSAHKDESMKNTFESHNLQGSEHKTMHQGKTAIAKEWESHVTDKKDTMMKSAEHNMALKTKVHEQQISQSALSGLDNKVSMKSAEHNSELKNHKSDDTFVKKSGLSAHSEMKLADNINLESAIDLNGPINVQLSHDVNLNSDKLHQEKSALLPKALDLEQARGAYGHHELGHHAHGHLEHGYGHGHHIHGHHMHGHHELGHGLGHIVKGHIGHHGHHGYHGKSAEFDSAMHQSMQTEIKDFAEKSAMDNMLQWKHHKHDAARSSYGLGGYGSGLNLGVSGGPGAVGLFPHAKVGGCGIPLLLSCAPSVVPGSLVKSHASYAAPAYRKEEDSSFKKKRDIIKTKEITNKNVKDIAKITKPKDLEKKL